MWNVCAELRRYPRLSGKAAFASKKQSIPTKKMICQEVVALRGVRGLRECTRLERSVCVDVNRASMVVCSCCVSKQICYLG